MTTPSDPSNKQKNSDNILDYLKTHSRETIAYAILILGLLLLFFAPVYGGLLIGIVTGIYFGEDIINYLTNWKAEVSAYGMARNLIAAGVALAFFISAPAIFLGLALAIGIKQLFIGPNG